MKKILLSFVLVLLTATAAFGQEALVYTKLAAGSTAKGDRVVLNGTNAAIDSTYKYLLAHGTVSDVAVYSAERLAAARTADLANGPWTRRDPYKATDSAIWAAKISGATRQLISGESGHWSNAFTPGYLPLNAAFGQSTTSAATDFSSTTSAPWVAKDPGTIKNFYLAEDAAPTGGHDTIQVFKNGTVQTMKIVIANTATSGSDATNTITVAKGDKFYIGGTAGSTNNGTAATWSFDFYPN